MELNIKVTKDKPIILFMQTIYLFGSFGEEWWQKIKKAAKKDNKIFWISIKEEVKSKPWCPSRKWITSWPMFNIWSNPHSSMFQACFSKKSTGRIEAYTIWVKFIIFIPISFVYVVVTLRITRIGRLSKDASGRSVLKKLPRWVL